MREHALEITIVTVIVALIGALIWATVEDAKEWERFKAGHDCKVVARVRGETMSTVTYGTNGQVHIGTTSTPDKTGWLCNDGVTYYR